MTYAELAALQAKRSKTFSEAQVEAMATYCQAEHDLKEMQAENAKLRELVRKMYSVMDMADYVHEFDDPMHLMFVDDMRELGIEVDA